MRLLGRSLADAPMVASSDHCHDLADRVSVAALESESKRLRHELNLETDNMLKASDLRGEALKTATAELQGIVREAKVLASGFWAAGENVSGPRIGCPLALPGR